jgi:hypothetical protein
LSGLVKWGSWLALRFDDQAIEGTGRAVGHVVRWGSKKALEFDYQYIEGTGKAVVTGLEKSSGAVHSSNDGDLNGNLVKLLIGISIVLLIVLVETGVSL